ncbi:hypothetical protein Q6350_10100 [Isoptericola sp. b515]|uniref:hypothetical protein n=1 Tax=Isoptericola sp. b515 TaxID=3064652 RepID=UPI002713577C|nr:hypothetical protein [Isoptericola sp. b515]MDO8148782.1 hypothetical protein [Isoptericola sp. b515]
MGRPERRGVRRWLPLRLAVVAAVVLVGLLVAVLARQPSDDPVLQTYEGVPAGVAQDEPVDGEPGWVLGEDGRLAVYAAGSSSCPWRPTSVTADGNRVTVRLEVDGGPACTMDMVYRTSIVALPDGVGPDALEVELELVG